MPQLDPQFFDIFGVIVFGFITGLSLWALKKKKPLPRWSIEILFFIGISGFLIDSIIVYTFYLK